MVKKYNAKWVLTSVYTKTKTSINTNKKKNTKKYPKTMPIFTQKPSKINVLITKLKNLYGNIAMANICANSMIIRLFLTIKSNNLKKFMPDLIVHIIKL